MNPSYKPSHKPGHKPERPRHVRSDTNTREVVDQAIAAIPAIGIRQAAEFLSAMNVPPSVAVRALVYPQRRRA